ncbi:MAG: ATP-binding protein, partial [Candidatus Electrothrix sp. LOE2]|nr:ATP-binding protein [Candidatus Electrothrix sp. LOE2]
MPDTAKKQSNPFSEGGGGTNFETRVQAAFVVLMLSGRVAPCLPPFPIIKLKLQGSSAGFETDDFIAYAKQGEKEAKLLAQIKHDVSITTGNKNFVTTVHRAWNDFNNTSLFNPKTDSIALITGPLSATDIKHVRPVLEWARHCENETEFFLKLDIEGFASKEKKAKVEVFRTVLTEAKGAELSDRQLWSFLKSFHLIGYDLDQESGGTRSLLMSLIAQYAKGDPSALWTKILDAVQTANQNAGTVTFETLPEEITSAFSTADFSGWQADLKKLKEHGEYILQNIRTTVGTVHIPQPDALTQLLDCSESSDFVLVSGERGAGKSSLIRSFSDAASERTPIFCLRTEDLDQPHLDNVFSAIGLQSSLADLEAGFALIPKKYLMIESLEKLLELSRTAAFTDLLQFLNKQHGWTVIATCRDYAYQQIVFHHLQPAGVNFSSLDLHGFTDEDVQNLCQQLVPLQQFSENKALKTFLHSPFYADLVFRVLGNGGEFAPDQGEREFIDAVWQHVIVKEQERANGMPGRRRQVFIDLAVQRAKKMVYGVPERGFDSDVLLNLEADDLARRDKKSLVSPAHDVFEDWALERYIEEAFQEHLGEQADFLAEIGNEPAITRAFRLWLHRKLRLGEDVEDFIYSVLTSKDVARYWQDETIAALLQGDNPDDFLRTLKKQLLADEGELLQRFCFILRTACQTPVPRKDDSKPSILFLKPHGNGWQALICFLFNNKDYLPYTFRLHIAAVLKDWVYSLRADEPLPAPAREVGLLALHLLDDLKNSYSRDEGRKEILRIIIRTSSAITEEFTALVETDILATSRRNGRPGYADDFCELFFSIIESAFVCTHNPELLVKLFYFEWVIPEENTDKFRSSGGPDVDKHFGIYQNSYGHYLFFPASGVKGPFRNLIHYHPEKALNFILDLCNIAAERYAYSDLYKRDSGFQETDSTSPLVSQIEIQLNDGSSVRQYCFDRLWLAYRGISGVPPLLECALMALENMLIASMDYLDANGIERFFDHILRQSNSVLTTTILSSVATGFPDKAGKA